MVQSTWRGSNAPTVSGHDEIIVTIDYNDFIEMSRKKITMNTERGVAQMKEKKTAVITFRTEQWVKDALEEIANDNKWSVAQTVNELCKKYATNPRPEEIVIKASDFLSLAEEVKAEGEEKAVRLIFDLKVDNDKPRKVMRTEVWECGGYGCIPDFEEIREMTNEEIKNIP